MTPIHLVQTSAGAPEAYDAVTGDGQVIGSLHLRNGWFSVTAGDVVVYAKDTGGGYGVFDADERQRYLDLAVVKIAGHLAGPAVPDEARAKLAARAVAAALEEGAISDWDAGDGKVIEIYVSQIATIVERVLREGDHR